MKKSQSRVYNTLGGEPEFIISVAETQNVDLAGSTKLSMTLPLDKLTKLIQTFNKEISLIIKEFGGFVLKYVGDAVGIFGCI